MRVVVADRAVDLALQADLGDALAAAFQAMDDVRHLLAQRRRRRRLAMRARHHRQRGVFVRQIAQAGDCLVQRRQHHLIARRLEHQRVRQIVDVLRRTGEVDELGDAHDLGVVGEFLLDPVFERLHVVVGHRLDFLDLGGLLRTEGRHQLIKRSNRRRRKRRNLGEVRLGGERLEPLDLDQQASPDEAGLRELVTQGIDLGGIAAVQRRQGGKGIERHEVHPFR